MRAPRVGCQPDREGGFQPGMTVRGKRGSELLSQLQNCFILHLFFLRLIRNLRVGYQRTLEKGVKPRQIVHSESRTSGFTPFLTKILKFSQKFH